MLAGLIFSLSYIAYFSLVTGNQHRRILALRHLT